jgi:hypothetical protein
MPGTGPPCGGAEGVIALRRVGVIVAFGALVALFGGVVTAAPTLAVGRGDGWQFVPIPRHFTEAADHCGFPIRGTQLVDKVFMKALKTAGGTTIFLATGAAKVRFTNPSNGKSVTAVTSGPVKVIVNPDGSFTIRAKGHTPVGLSPAEQALTGLPGQFVSAGALTGTFDGNGNLISLLLRGHVLVNVCAALS